VATLSINNSEPKTIRGDHFGFDTDSGLPDLSGKWVLGNATSGDSYILNLTRLPPVVFGGVSLPYRDIAYSSSHVSTENWQLQCIVILSNEFNNSQCDLVKSSGLDNLTMTAFDIGNQRLTFFIEDDENPETYQAFRLNKDRRLLPSDGHWRTFDDPTIGSGVVMRTQGDYTVVLLYSYGTDGKAMWQIASGFFDETGKLVAELNTTHGGSTIESETPVSAVLQENTQTLEIQLQGTELATVSIDGSEPKTIQNYNFGVEFFSTDHLKVNNKSFVYPDQQGTWVLVDDGLSDSRISKLEPFDLNEYQTPPDPRLYGARQYKDNGTDDDFSLTFFCTKILSSGSFVFEVKPFCFGRHFIRPESGGLKLYYEDIGVNEFRYFFDEETSSNDVTGISRDSKLFYLFKLKGN
jgi:hypothetical protein